MKKQKMYTEHDFYHRVWKSYNLYGIYRNLTGSNRSNRSNIDAPTNRVKIGVMATMNAQNVTTSTAIRVL